MSAHHPTDAQPAPRGPTVSQIVTVELILGVVAATILYLRRAPVALVKPPLAQVAVGLPLGAAAGWLISSFLLQTPIRRALMRSVVPLRTIMATARSILVVAGLAGVCEELLFRGALQPWIGIVPASILFTVAHAGTARLNEGVSAGKTAYLLATFLAAIALGLLYRSQGLLCVMSAHAAVDASVLFVLAQRMA